MILRLKTFANLAGQRAAPRFGVNVKTVLLYCLICLLLTSCVVVGSKPDVGDPPFINPHLACASCHGSAKPKGAEANFPAAVDPSKFCLNCHNYRVNHHPINVVPVHQVDPAFPLYKGRITCLSCHEIHGGPGKFGTRRLLRGGPYEDRRAICVNCHSKQQYAEINPHQMRDAEGNHRTVDNHPVCLMCHVLEPNPDIDKANTVLFRADIGFLCWRCHPLMHSESLNRHFLKVPSEKVLANMSRPQIAQRYSLPLVPRDRLTCSTCHNPHQEGIISPGPAASGADSEHRLRDEEICEGCHNK